MGKVFIIAEAGVNHNGKVGLALKLCRAAKNAGADAVKFQSFITDEIVTNKANLADYQRKNTGKDISQYAMLRKLELKQEDFSKIKAYCGKIGIEFLSTPDDEQSLNFLIRLGLNKIKIGSGEITNIPFLRVIGSKRKNVILSTGMSNLEEVKRAYRILETAGAKSISLLHCTTSYPCPINEVNLKAISTLKNGFDAKVGYSDHTLSMEVPVAAVAMGAEIIEKHLTLDRRMSGPDHKASFEPDELSRMVEIIRSVELSLGRGIKKPSQSEIKNIKIVRKSIVASINISKGECFDSGNIATKRPGNGISPTEWDRVLGKKAKCNFKKDERIVL